MIGYTDAEQHLAFHPPIEDRWMNRLSTIVDALLRRIIIDMPQPESAIAA
jgi:hypothetical protein